MSDLVIVDAPAKLAPIYSPKEMLDLKASIDRTIRENLIENTDYGVIPGTKGKPTLLKPGAEKLSIAFGLRPDYEILDSTIDHSIEQATQKMVWNDRARRKEPVNGTSLGLYRYVIKCTLRNHRGDFMASGMGICSSLEAKYCDRPRDLENTINKMAQKRAFIAAVLNALGISGVFTQDMEDQAVSPKEETTPRPQQQGFDPNNKEHQDFFIKTMTEKGIADDRWDEIAKTLKGLPRQEVLEKVRTL